MTSYYYKNSEKQFRKIFKIIGAGFILLGILLSLYFLFPLFSYQFFLASAFGADEVEVPIPKYLVVNKRGDLGSLVSSGLTFLTSDFTDARNWYPNLAPQNQSKVESYLISIPKLNIENAEVSTQDYNLEKHMVQYLGTSIPGEKGTAVIFGHSTLPQLFNPKNYKTILANAHKLKIGDEFFINVGGITYRYKIFSALITDPEDTNILAQSFDHSYVTLVTCTPPGTIWKRLVIRASLESIL